MPHQTLSLSQQQRQMMILAPQLRQSLEMLQMPILELRAMIQQEMEQNPTIEDVIAHDVSVDAEKPADAGEPDAEHTQELDFDKEFEVLAEIDDEWRDYFFQNLQNTSYNPDDEEKRQYMLDSIRQPESLQEHLIEQLNLTDLEEADRQIGLTLIGSLNDDGYLQGDLDSLARQTNTDVKHLEEVLAVIQEFHPSGIGAHDLRECLLLQLDRLTPTETIKRARTIVRRHLDALAGHKFPQMARALKVDVTAVQEAAALVRALDPKPGRIFSQDVAGYVTAEVIVQKVDGQYVVMVDDHQLPHVRISSHYRRLMRNPDTPNEVRSYIRERIRSGAFLIRSMHQRQKTIYRIASAIVERQQAFLEAGISRLKPMTMSEVAQQVGVHETTVSRTVANKYMQTPRGLYELKFFFTPGIQTADGPAISNQSVKDLIARLVQQEDPKAPLSDQAIQENLAEQGIRVARRTVAKYRLMLRLPPSHLRKRY